MKIYGRGITSLLDVHPRAFRNIKNKSWVLHTHLRLPHILEVESQAKAINH